MDGANMKNYSQYWRSRQCRTSDINISAVHNILHVECDIISVLQKSPRPDEP